MFGTDCFWCTEALRESLNGVVSAVSGYQGGQKPTLTYNEVCTGTTGHAECVEISYNPVVAEITPAETFYAAEAYHQNYFANNPNQGYFTFVAAPEVDKLRKVFKEKLKPELAH